MLRGRDIILISSIEWEFNWQGHQEIASRLARAGNRVLYVENMGVRSPGLHDVGRVARRFSHWMGSASYSRLQCTTQSWRKSHALESAFITHAKKLLSVLKRLEAAIG